MGNLPSAIHYIKFQDLSRHVNYLVENLRNTVTIYIAMIVDFAPNTMIPASGERQINSNNAVFSFS